MSEGRILRVENEKPSKTKRVQSWQRYLCLHHPSPIKQEARAFGTKFHEKISDERMETNL